MKDNFLPQETRNPNLFAFLTSQGDAGGTVGIAYVGVVCDSVKQFKVSITEYVEDDLMTAEVILFN